MQLSFFRDPLPEGYVHFYPDVPTEIFLALGGVQALEKVGAHNILNSHNALHIDVCAANGVTMIHVTQNVHKAYDIYFYNGKGACVSYAYHVHHHELAGVFRSGTGLVSFRKKYIGSEPAVCREETAVV